MTTLNGFSETTLRLPQAKVELRSAGEGQTFLFLHPGEGLIGASRFLEMLAGRAHVLVPSHPGFGQSELPRSLSTVDDLSYVYLDLLDQLDLRDVVLVGASFGGWIAAEMAVKNTQRLSRVVLIDSLGIKIRDRDARDIADMHAMGRDALAAHLYADPDKNRPDFMNGPPELAESYARDRESFTYFGWQPYMHNPKLHGRLRRIDVPTLVLWGEADKIVSPDYGRAFAQAIPDARFELIGRAGHMSHVENPDVVAREVLGFAGLNLN